MKEHIEKPIDGLPGFHIYFFNGCNFVAALPASKGIHISVHIQHRWTFVRTDVEGLDEIRGLTEAGKWEEWRRGLKALLADTLGKLKKAIPELQEGVPVLYQPA
ncbi:hypothetical protein Tco_0190102 [Tanacetum coccineum]